MLYFLTDAAAGATGGSMFTTIFMLVAMVGVFYFMMIRPENKRKKEAEQMRASLKKGDKIVTIGGITGVIVDVKENRFVMETGADQVRIELEKWAVSTNETAAEAKKAADKKAQEVIKTGSAKCGACFFMAERSIWTLPAKPWAIKGAKGTVAAGCSRFIVS